MRNKRILVFISCFAHGGAEKQGALLARHLQSEGYGVEVWGFPSRISGTSLKRQLDRWNIAHRELRRLPPLNWRFPHERPPLRFLHRQFWALQVALFGLFFPRGAFDVVVPFTFWPCLAASLMQRKLKARRVLWNHRGGFDDAGMTYTPLLVEQILRARPVFVANSTAGARFLQQVFSLQAGAVHVVRNAYAPEEGEDGRGLDPHQPERPVTNLLHLANFFPEKDVETLLEGVRLLKSGGVQCLLHLAGSFPEGKYRNAIEEKVTALDIHDCVRLYGSVDREKVQLLLREADIGLLSSRSEGMPNSVMEYMYRGLPVVATDIPGVREVVGDDNAEWLFPIGDASVLQELVTRLARDGALRMKLGIANRQRIVDEFNVGRIMRQWTRLLEAL